MPPTLLVALLLGLNPAAAQTPPAAAPLLPEGVHEGRIAPGQRAQWWRIHAETPERIELDLEIVDRGVDLDLFLYREAELGAALPQRPPPGAWHESTRGPEVAHERIVAVLEPGLYLLAVGSPQGAPAAFRLLRARGRVEAGDLGSAWSSWPLIDGATVSGLVDYDLGPREEWWHFDASTPGAVAVELAGDLRYADLNLSIHPPDRPGLTLAAAASPRSSFEVARLWAPPGRYLVRVWAQSSGNASGYRLWWRGASEEEVSGPQARPDGALPLGAGTGPRWIDSAGRRTNWWRAGPAGHVRYHGPPGVTLIVFDSDDLSRAGELLDAPGTLPVPAGALLRVQAGPGAAGAYELTPTSTPPAPDGGQRPAEAVSVDSGGLLAMVTPQARTAWFRIDWPGGPLRIGVSFPAARGELAVALTGVEVLRTNLPGYYANLREPLAWGGADGAGGLTLASDLGKGVYFLAVFLHSGEGVPFELQVGD